MGSQQETTSERPRGRIERAMYVCVPRAYRDGFLDQELDAGSVALARTIGRACDQAAADGNYFAVAQLSRELRELLQRMKLEPTSRGAGANDLSDILKAISTPE